MTAKLRVAGIVLCLLALAGLILLLARPELAPHRAQPLELTGAAWVVFGCAVWLARKAAVKVTVGLIVIGGIALQVLALTGPPRNSSDLYRYIWDGRVQAAGIDPYLYAPGDAGVARLRDDFLWSGTGTGHYVDCVPDRPDHADPAGRLMAGCTKLNRPRVQTVYPPVAEAYFTAVQLVAPEDDSTTPIQAGAAVFAVLTTVILLFGLRRFGKDPRLAALWAWSPTVALEAGQNGHVDVLAVALTAVALLVLAGAQAKRRVVLGGVLLGLAIATKVTPVLVLPGVVRRGWRLIGVSVAAAVAIVYVPHVIAVGSKIIGYFPGYLHQEGYSDGTGFSVIGLFAAGKAATALAVVILGVIAAAIIRYCDPAQPWHGGVLMTSAALTVCTPHFQWYAILLVMLVALDGRPEWLTIAAGGYMANSPNFYLHGFVLHDPRLAGYGGGAAIACALALTRWYLGRRHPSPAADMAVDMAVDMDADAAESPPVGEDVIEPASVIAPATVSGKTIAGSYRVLTGNEIPEREEVARP